MKKPTPRTKVKRVPGRGKYDSRTINGILDAHYLCHIGFVHEGHPVVIPTLYGRLKDKIFIHGATTSRLITTLKAGPRISLAVTLVDGMVLARSAFHHSINYRSVVLFGKAREIISEEEKLKALKVISEHILPGRWQEVRRPNSKELKATSVLEVPVSEASAKIRTGPPLDEKADYDLDVWAGVLPLTLVPGNPLADPDSRRSVSLSDSISNYLNVTG